MSERLLADLLQPVCSGGSAVAIGAFDGLHLGHQHIIRDTVEYAGQYGLESVAILFDPLPSQFFGRLGMDQRILLSGEQEELLSHLGIARKIILPFTEEIASIPAESFLKTLSSVLHCRRLFMGEDFTLGKDRSGTPETITKMGAELCYTTEILAKDVLDGDVISSTRIRALLQSGRVDEANRLLSYNYFFTGHIIHGVARGRKLGFPTLNVHIPEGKLRLPNGVYAVNAVIDGQVFASVTNIGVRPTFEPENRNVVAEAFLLNADGNFYGKTARLEFVRMLRKEIRFSSGEALREQITRDISSAREILL